MPPTTKLPLRHVAVPPTAVGMKFCDTVEIDQNAHRLYAGDNWAGGVDVFDIASPEAKYLKTIKTKGGFYGIAVAAELRKVFVGLAGGMLGVIDVDPRSPSVDTFVARIDIGATGSADLIEYVPALKKVYAGMHNDKCVGVIDGVTHAVVAKIGGLGGAIEQPRYNEGDGMVYVASRTANALHQIDRTLDRCLPFGTLLIGGLGSFIGLDRALAGGRLAVIALVAVALRGPLVGQGRSS